MYKQLAIATVLLAAAAAQAQISVTGPAFTYSQSFDSLATSGTTNAWSNGVSPLAGWSLFNRTGAAITTYGAENGGDNAGAFKSYGSNSSTERALGGLGSGGSYFGSPASGTIAGGMALALTNGTGSALAGFTLGFEGEQWRQGGNTTAQTMVLEYGFGNSFGTVAGWTAPGAGFDFTSPVVGASATALDGNSAANRVAGLGGTVATAWAAGDTLWVRWTERNDVGNDHGLAIDDLSFSVTAVPEPGTYALLLAGLAAVGFVARRRS